jgi:hypothetical protein
MRESARRTRAPLAALLLLAVGALVARAGEADLSAPLPVDPHVRIERLANGLECWVRPHGTPPNRVAIWLHVGSGSINEAEDQRGLAHFLEHLAFNGSEHFPPGELVRYFESIGLTFGRHQNAFTGFDQTMSPVMAFTAVNFRRSGSIGSPLRWRSSRSRVARRRATSGWLSIRFSDSAGSFSR